MPTGSEMVPWHAQGLRNKNKLSCKACTIQVAEVKRIHEQKHLVLAEAILSKSARTINQKDTGQSRVMWLQFQCPVSCMYKLVIVTDLPSNFHSTHWPVANLYSKRSFLLVRLELE